jgi:hypothetical protein
MKKTVLIITIIGGVLGIFFNVMFYVFGSIATVIVSAVFKGIIPVLDLSEADAAMQKIIYINSVSASVLCIIAAGAGILYFMGDKDEGGKKQRKYIAAVILLVVCAGLFMTISIFSLVLIAVAALIALISTINDFRNDLVPDRGSAVKKMLITALLSAIVLAAVYFIPHILV